PAAAARHHLVSGGIAGGDSQRDLWLVGNLRAGSAAARICRAFSGPYAVLALGTPRWEMIRMGVLRNARIGIVGGVILGLGRALGETMAVAMVIGNRPEVAKSLFA